MLLRIKLCSAMVCAVIALAGCGLFMPRADRAVKLARETSAAARVRTIAKGETIHFLDREKYATLAELGAAKLIPEDLAAGKVDGYVYTVTLKPKGFEIVATPVESGMRKFSSDESLELHETKPAE